MSDVLAPSIRATAAKALVSKAAIDNIHVLPLLIASLAGDSQAMKTSIDSNKLTIEVVCSDIDALRLRAVQLQLLQEKYGSPIVIVESERPTDPLDMRTSASVEAFFTILGFYALKGDALRKQKRDLTDKAVRKGMSPELGLSLLDNQDADFILRVSQKRRAIPRQESYGIKLSTYEILITISVLRAADQLLVDVRSITATITSASVVVSERQSDEVVVADASLAAAAIIAAQWAKIASGESACLIEVEAPSSAECSRIARLADDGKLVILENRAEIRCLFEIPFPVVDKFLFENLRGSILSRRPGYILVSGTSIAYGKWIIYLFLTLITTIVSYLILRFFLKK